MSSHCFDNHILYIHSFIIRYGWFVTLERKRIVHTLLSCSYFGFITVYGVDSDISNPWMHTWDICRHFSSSRVFCHDEVELSIYTLESRNRVEYSLWFTHYIHQWFVLTFPIESICRYIEICCSFWMNSPEFHYYRISYSIECRHSRMENWECRAYVLMKWWNISEERCEVRFYIWSERFYRDACCNSCEHFSFGKWFFLDFFQESLIDTCIVIISFMVDFPYFKKP